MTCFFSQFLLRDHSFEKRGHKCIAEEGNLINFDE